MEENKPLYMPVRVQDAEDFIAGIGKLEISLIFLSLVISLVLGITIGILVNILLGVGVGFFIIFSTVITVKRDLSNENLIQRVSVIKKYIGSKKYFLYEYRTIFLEKVEEQVYGR